MDERSAPMLSATFTVGSLQVAALSDGAPMHPEPWRFFVGAQEADWVRELGLSGPQPIPYNLGTFLIRGDGHTTLVDSGWGAPIQTLPFPGAGRLLERLKELGVEPADIDRVVHTHLHRDHCGWDVDEGGTPTFPNATYYVQQREIDYWMSDEADSNVEPQFTRSRLHPLLEGGRIEALDGEVSLGESLTVIPTPGHTPGHASVMLASEGSHLLILGDLANHPLHLSHVDWTFDADVDPTLTRTSRVAMYQRAASIRALVTGGHFPIPTVGRLREDNGHFQFDPVEVTESDREEEPPE